MLEVAAKFVDTRATARSERRASRRCCPSANTESHLSLKTFDADRFDAVLFDLDGVLTATAKVHAASWKQMFDEFLVRRAQQVGGDTVPFEIDTDYKLYVDGKPRLDGIRSFLESRGVELPPGDPGAPANYDTIAGLGKHKNGLFQQALETGDIEAYEGSIAFVHYVRSHRIRTAVVSSSHNCHPVIEAVGIENLFDVVVDGNVAARLKLAGKPAPDTFLKAAQLLEIAPSDSVVVEDAISGVQAGSSGGFGLVIGVDRTGDAESLSRNGADLVVTDLAELMP